MTEHCGVELRRIGLTLLNVNITNITDDRFCFFIYFVSTQLHNLCFIINSGVIEAMGRKAAADAVQTARVDVSEKEKVGAVGVSVQEREKVFVWFICSIPKEIQVANNSKEREIGIKEAEQLTKVRIADLEATQTIGTFYLFHHLICFFFPQVSILLPFVKPNPTPV